MKSILLIINKLIIYSLNSRYSKAREFSRVSYAISTFQERYNFTVFKELCFFTLYGALFPSYLPALITKVLISRL